MNRAHKILHTLTKKPLNGQRLHHLCVAIYYLHDLRLQGLDMLTSLKITFFWTRSSFRLQDLTVLLYRFEVCPIILYILKPQDVSSLRELPVPCRNRKLHPCCRWVNFKIFPLHYQYLTSRKRYDQRADAHFLPRRLSRIFTTNTWHTLWAGPAFFKQYNRSLPLFYFVQVSNGPSR